MLLKAARLSRAIRGALLPPYGVGGAGAGAGAVASGAGAGAGACGKPPSAGVARPAPGTVIPLLDGGAPTSAPPRTGREGGIRGAGVVVVVVVLV